MKYTKAVILLFFSVLAQVSFLRLIDFFPFMPNMPFVVLFVLSYRLPRIGIIFLAALTGALVDLFSAAPFGLSVFSAAAAFFVYGAIQEKFFKGKNFGNMIFSSVMVSFSFYLFFSAGSRVLSFLGGSNLVFNPFDKNMVSEIILTVAIAACLAYFFESGINYDNIRHYKKFFKISA